MRPTTFVIIGAGFSVDAGIPVAAGVLRKAARVTSGVVETLEPILREEGLIGGALIDEDIEALLLKLCPLLRFLRPHFRQYLSPGLLPELLYDGMRVSKNNEIIVGPADLWRSLLILYFAVVTDYYEPNPMDAAMSDEPAEWLDPLPEQYVAFANALPSESFVATTNYDDTIERALLASERCWTYGCSVYYADFMRELEYKPGNGVYYNELDRDKAWHPGRLIGARGDWRCRDERRDLTLCKLHGSFRWLQCRDCANIYSVDYWGAQPLGEFLGYSAPAIRSHAFFCWNRECFYTPLTVALFPDDRKHFDVENAVLEQTWSTAIHAARRCKDLIIIGSALRDSDHDLLRLVRIAAARARRLIVINPSEAHVRRAESIAGMTATWFRSIHDFNASA